MAGPKIIPKTSISGNKEVAELIFEKVVRNGQATGIQKDLFESCDQLLGLLDRDLQNSK